MIRLTLSSALLLFAALSLGAEPIRDLQQQTQSCQKNFPSGGATSTQEGFEACLQAAVGQYYTATVTKVWGAPKSPPRYVEASPAPTAAPPPIDRAKEEARLKEEVRRLVKSVKCQRCHSGMDGSQFTLAQVHSVLNTPSHRERLDAKELDLLKRLGAVSP